MSKSTIGKFSVPELYGTNCEKMLKRTAQKYLSERIHQRSRRVEVNCPVYVRKTVHFLARSTSSRRSGLPSILSPLDRLLQPHGPETLAHES